MTIQLYDVYSESSRETGSITSFVMRAPLKTIDWVLRLHQDAVARIVRETDAGGDCNLYQRDGTHYIVSRVALPPKHRTVFFDNRGREVAEAPEDGIMVTLELDEEQVTAATAEFLQFFSRDGRMQLRVEGETVSAARLAAMLQAAYKEFDR